MSRVGIQPIAVPKGVNISLKGLDVNVKGPKGDLSFTYMHGIEVKQEGEELLVSRQREDRQSKANHGTVRSIINNMVVGVSEGYKKTLELKGVGYTAKMAGDVLTLKVGFSHDVKVTVPKVVKCTVEGTKIHFESCDKAEVGQIAAKVRKVKPPEPYLGVGIRYENEVVRRKAGKAGK